MSDSDKAEISPESEMGTEQSRRTSRYWWVSTLLALLAGSVVPTALYLFEAQARRELLPARIIGTLLNPPSEATTIILTSTGRRVAALLETGRFYFNDVPAGYQTIQYGAPGYEPAAFETTVRGGEDNQVELPPLQPLLAQVVEGSSNLESLKYWTDVPVGSVLELKLEQNSGVLFTAELLTSTTNKTTFQNDELTDTLQRIELDSATTYTARISMSFSDESSEAIMSASIRTSQGMTHGVPFLRRLRGSPGIVATTTLVVDMLGPSWQSYVAGVDGVSNPRPISRVAPDYPRLAREAGVEGKVVLAIVVGSDGDVRESEVVLSSTLDYGFEEAAQRAVMQWRFYPAEKDGEPVDAQFTVVQQFTLQP